MNKQSIAGLSTTSSGTIIVLKSHSFSVSSQGATIETDVGNIHKDPLNAFCCTRDQTPEGSFPSLLLSSRGLVSSWNSEHGAPYDFVSKVSTYSSPPLATTSMCLCKNALAVSYESCPVVDIIAVADNLGLSFFRKIDNRSPVQSIAIVLNERANFILISACTSRVVIWDLMAQKSSSAPSFKSKGASLMTARYDRTKGKGFIGHYQINGEFRLFSILTNEKTGSQHENVFTVNLISEFSRYDQDDAMCPGLQMDFVNDNERLCILVTKSDVVVIDSLQKCIVKKISVASLFNEAILNHSVGIEAPIYCSKASIKYPFVSLYSNESGFLIQHELDEVFSLVGSLQPTESKMQDAKFKPLIMTDRVSITRLNSKFSGTMRIQRKSTGNKLIKSSGYCKVVELKLGQCPSKLEKDAKLKAQAKATARAKDIERKKSLRYPLDCLPIDSHQAQHDDYEYPCCLPPLAAVSFDSLGEYLAASTVDKGLHILKLPFSKHGSGSTQVMQSHPSVESRRAPPISSCRPSWSITGGKGKMIAYDNRVYTLSGTMKSMKVAIDFGEEASNAGFCFRDQILLHTERNKLFLNKGGSASALHSIPFAGTQRITSVASVNARETNIIAVSCSDKSINVVDIETGTNLWSQNFCAGARPANCITFPNVSNNIPLSPDSFNLLLATSPDEGGVATIWDLRCGELVNTYKGHANRRDQCLGSFSPCMRYIGVGGEGNCASATIYDIRSKGSCPALLHNWNIGKNRDGVPFRDGSVLDVQFHPLYPQLVTSSISGRLRWFREDR